MEVGSLLMLERLPASLRNPYFKGKSLQFIGKTVNKDHSTVLHSLRNFDNLYSFDKEYTEKFNKYEDHLLRKFKIEDEVVDLDLLLKENIQLKANRTFWKNKSKKLTDELTYVKQQLTAYKHRNKKIIKKYHSSVWKEKLYELRKEHIKLMKNVR